MEKMVGADGLRAERDWDKVPPLAFVRVLLAALQAALLEDPGLLLRSDAASI